MDRHFRTELGALLGRDTEGASRSVEHAVSLLQAQQAWTGEDRAETNSSESEFLSTTDPFDGSF